MKKLLFLLSLFVCLQVSGQILPGIVAAAGSGGYVARSAEYQAVYDAITVKPTADTVVWQDDMVYSLDSAGYWDLTARLFVFANRNEQAALLEWKGGISATNNSSTSFTPYEGYIGDDNADYIDLNFNPYADSSIYKLNSASFGAYIRNDLEDNGAVLGAVTAAGDIYMIFNSSQLSARVNGELDQIYAATDSRGMWIATRRAVTEIEVYWNNVSRDTEADISTGIPNDELYVLRANGSLTYTAYQVSIVIFTSGLTDEQAIGLSIILNRYMMRIGKNTYDN